MYVLDSETIRGFSEQGYYFQRTNGRKLSDEPHAHTFYEFILVVSGSCVHELDGKKQDLKIGNLALVKPGSTHRFLSQSDNTDIIVLSAAASETEKLFALYDMSAFPLLDSVIRLSPDKRQILLSLCGNGTVAEVDGYRKRMRMILNQIFLFCMDPICSQCDVPKPFADVLEKMRELSFAARGVEALLALSGYSHSQLCRLMKKYFGVTPTEYVNRIRLEHAYNLIAYGNLGCETVCRTVGFESYRYFSALLKEKFGSSASEIRKEFKSVRKTV